MDSVLDSVNFWIRIQPNPKVVDSVVHYKNVLKIVSSNLTSHILAKGERLHVTNTEV